jgi:YHS domain-containing protein
MNIRSVLVILVITITSTLIVLAGCKKQPSEVTPHEHEMASMSEGAEATMAKIEQKMCPVMTDMKINPDVFTEYKGKKVYFCCTDCKAKFEAFPEKYIANLPQFNN